MINLRAVKFFPADRLPLVAKRVLAAQPAPPRKVTWSDIWQVNWPMLLWILAPAAIMGVIAIGSAAYRPLAIFLTGMAVLVLVIWTRRIIMPGIAALELGQPDVGTVVDVMRSPRSGYAGHLRLGGNGPESLTAFTYLSDRPVAEGTQLDVLVDPTRGKVLATLGPVAAQP